MTQDDQYQEYRDYLRQGTRIEIGIPLSGGGIFRDWAIIEDSGGDQLLARISRDVLPADLRVEEGFILDISISIKKDVYTCSGIVTEKVGDGRTLRVRLFGDFTLRERRQFFRSYLKLKVRYAFIAGDNRDEIRSDWERRKDLEHMKFQGYDDFVIAGQRARFNPAVKLEWRELAWGEINLGGGGICISIPEPARIGELAALEVHLPLTPPRQVQSVAEVIYATPTTSSREALNRVGMQFLYLDERDRDFIFRHISVTQLAYLRKIAEKREPRERELGGREPAKRQYLVRTVVWSLVALLVSTYVIWFLIQYQRQGSPNEIGQTYEKALRKYRHEER